MIFSILIVTGVITGCWYLFCVFFLYKGLRILPTAGKPGGHRFSVVIAARNESQNIGPCLDSLFRQSISPERFEVIVVNDRSTDMTLSIVNQYMRQFPRLHLVHIHKILPGYSPKKYAVSQGVQTAQHEIIVFTDADCRVPATWLSTIDRYLAPSVGLVQGITSYFRPEGMNRLFFNLQSIDFLSHGIVAAAAIGARFPINSNANNFAFRKIAYIETGGFSTKIGHIVSGDDDLLLQKIWQQKKWDVVFMDDNEGSVVTQPTENLMSLFNQRARWSSKTVHYSKRQVLFLGGIFLFYLTIPVFFLLSLFNHYLLPAGAAMLFLKLFGEILLMVPGLKRFHHPCLIPFIPLGSLLQLPLVLAAVIIGIFGKFTWKKQTFSRTVPEKKRNT